MKAQLLVCTLLLSASLATAAFADPFSKADASAGKVLVQNHCIGIFRRVSIGFKLISSRVIGHNRAQYK